jgi:hypothetical protein
VRHGPVSCRARPGQAGDGLSAGARKAKGPPWSLAALHRKRGQAVCRRWWRNRGKRSRDRRRTEKDVTKPQPWAGCSRAVLASRSSSSSRRSSAMLIEVSTGSRVAGPDRCVGGLLDQGQLLFAGHGRLRLPGAVCQSTSRTSERQTVRQSPAAGEALFGARVLCAFAYWQGARDRRIWRFKRGGPTWRCPPSRAPWTGTLGTQGERAGGGFWDTSISTGERPCPSLCGARCGPSVKRANARGRSPGACATNDSSERSGPWEPSVRASSPDAYEPPELSTATDPA